MNKSCCEVIKRTSFKRIYISNNFNSNRMLCCNIYLKKTVFLETEREREREKQKMFILTIMTTKFKCKN